MAESEQVNSLPLKPAHFWPATRPSIPTDDHGWFLPENESMLKSFLNKKTKVVLELGSWLGKSTRAILRMAPNALVIAVDTWLGGPDHKGPNGICHEKLPTLYETFLTNCWDFRDRLIPLRMTTIEGMDFVHQHGYLPDLIYIDADHSYDAVCCDIETATRLFPLSSIVGDDWGWGADLPVQRAAKDMASKFGFKVVSNGWAWTFKKPFFRRFRRT